MYESCLIQEKEKDLFNKFIGSSARPHFLQSYEWGELKKGTGWEPIRFLLKNENLPAAAVSLLKRRLPFFRKSIFYAPRGPIFGRNCLREEEDFFWKEVKKLARQHGAIFLKIDPDISKDDGEYRDRLKRWGFRPQNHQEGFGGLQPRFVFRLDVTAGEEELLAAMKPKTRYNIRLAERKGVQVREARDKRDLAVFYALLMETANRDGFLIRSAGYFEKIWDLFVVPGTARIFLAEYQGQIIAGTLAFHFGDRVWYLYGASGNSHRKVMPNYLLQWTMIRWARSLGCTIYDFRGVPGDANPDHPLHGLYRFKEGFGAAFTEFIGEYDLVFSPFWYFLWARVLPFYQQLLFRLRRKKQVQGNAPLPVAE